MNHEQLRDRFLEEDTRLLLKCSDIFVEEFEDIKSGYKITFVSISTRKEEGRGAGKLQQAIDADFFFSPAPPPFFFYFFIFSFFFFFFSSFFFFLLLLALFPFISQRRFRRLRATRSSPTASFGASGTLTRKPALLPASLPSSTGSPAWLAFYLVFVGLCWIHPSSPKPVVFWFPAFSFFSFFFFFLNLNNFIKGSDQRGGRCCQLLHLVCARLREPRVHGRGHRLDRRADQGRDLAQPAELFPGR